RGDRFRCRRLNMNDPASWERGAPVAAAFVLARRRSASSSAIGLRLAPEIPLASVRVKSYTAYLDAIPLCGRPAGTGPEPALHKVEGGLVSLSSHRDAMAALASPANQSGHLQKHARYPKCACCVAVRQVACHAGQRHVSRDVAQHG